MKALLRWLLPKHVRVPLREELRMAGVRIRSALRPAPRFPATPVLLNIGSGATGRAGWLNVDGLAGPGVQHVCDLRRGLPLPDGSARGIFCEHFLEHLDYDEEVPRFLAECRRVLVAGGVLRIVVPDAERYLKAYAGGGWEELARIRPLDAGRRDRWSPATYRTRLELINAVFRQGYEHKYAWDYETLALRLADAGFRDVRRAEFRRSLLPELCIDQANRASESLYAEALR